MKIKGVWEMSQTQIAVTKVDRKVSRIRRLVEKGFLERQHLDMAESARDLYLVTGDSSFLADLNNNIYQ